MIRDALIVHTCTLEIKTYQDIRGNFRHDNYNGILCHIKKFYHLLLEPLCALTRVYIHVAARISKTDFLQLSKPSQSKRSAKRQLESYVILHGRAQINASKVALHAMVRNQTDAQLRLGKLF